MKIEQHGLGQDQFRTTLESLISLASRAADIFERSKNEEKRQLIAFVFSNLALNGKKLEFSLRSPFDLMVNRATYASWLWPQSAARNSPANTLLNSVFAGKFCDFGSFRRTATCSRPQLTWLSAANSLSKRTGKNCDQTAKVLLISAIFDGKRLCQMYGSRMTPSTQLLIEKIKALPAERVGEIEDFVDFIATRAQDRALTNAAKSASAPSFAKIWNNPDDDDYDAL